MKEENVVVEKSYAFAVRVVKLYKFLCETKKEFVLSKQFLKAGTSVGANIEEAVGGQSEKDFYAKLYISYKEARETHFWLRVMRDTGYLTENEAQSMLVDCDELLKIIGSILKTLRGKFDS